MRSRPSLFINMDKYNPVDADDHLPVEFVPYLATDGDRRFPEADSLHADFDDIPLPGRADKIDFRHELGDDVPFAQLTADKNGGLLIDPRQQVSPEQGPVGVQILRLDHFSAVEIHTRKGF